MILIKTDTLLQREKLKITLKRINLLSEKGKSIN